MSNFKEYIDQQYETFNGDEKELSLDEKMYYDWKIRDGKRTKKWHTDRKNYRIQINKKTGMPKEVFITPSERLKRKIGQRKAAIKRRAKQKNTTSKRLKSFHVRHNFGTQYNTLGHGKRRHVHHGNVDSYLENDNLYPNMLEARLLCETPWVEILPDLVWDFYSELDPATWLLQLVSLCEDREMVSLNFNPDSNNGEVENHIHVTDEQFYEIMNRLMNDNVFIRMAKYAYHNDMTPDESELFDATMETHCPSLLAMIK